MKKHRGKLGLNRETIRALSDDLERVAGGLLSGKTCSMCSISTNQPTIPPGCKGAYTCSCNPQCAEF